ncbi:MAG TPA: sigma 54-interacting transcriptional regulator, partial [Polyangiaceae bacterium]|nr:sigma 54-interacting transcriptional regulator [Polyangiaceae bacterium]
MPLLTLNDYGAHSLSVRAKALVFEDPQSRALLERLEQVAPSEATVLITGETGTGKEIVARYIHQLSRRSDKAFVAVNCGALTESLIESELFGHEKGAFTGALGSKAGWFEAANGGTLFLDEIGDLPISMQVKLLRVLQEGEVVRVGARQSTVVDVRLVAATNVSLGDAVAAGRFREDLFYRLHVASVTLPPLRERPADILPLARYFVRLYEQRLGVGGIVFDSSAVARLLQHSWPGNIRELENVIHHALLVCKHSEISAEDLRLAALPARFSPAKAPPASVGPASPTSSASAASTSVSGHELLSAALVQLFDVGLPDLYDQIERTVMRTAFEYCDRNQLQTARLLGISRNVVRARLIEHGEIAGSVRPSPNQTPKPAATPLGSRASTRGEPRRPLKIGFQKFGLLPLLKSEGALAADFEAHGFELDWIEYPGGIQIIEAFKSGDLAFGSVGEGPPVFAHAESIPFVYLAAEEPAPEDEALVVLPHSSIRSVRELVGRRVALNRGANVHYLLLRALEEAGIRYEDLEVVYLTPERARAALAAGEVDAWAIWNPLLNELVQAQSVRVLRDAAGLAD